MNLWCAEAPALADAYVRSAGPIRFEVVTRALLAELPNASQRIVDIGGGYGRQAVLLARAGHRVVIVEIDRVMLELAGRQLEVESQDVRSRVELVLALGETASNVVGGGFDVACCHSVLMYQEDPVPMLTELVHLVRAGGLISVLSLNASASAMRSGLQGRWKDVVASLQAGKQVDGSHVEVREHSLDKVIEILERAGATPRWWHGVGVFTDHRTEPISPDDLPDVVLAEWLAGNRDPYRQVARCFHLIAERARDAASVLPNS